MLSVFCFVTFLLCFFAARSFAYLFVHLVLACRIKVNFARPTSRPSRSFIVAAASIAAFVTASVIVFVFVAHAASEMGFIIIFIL